MKNYSSIMKQSMIIACRVCGRLITRYNYIRVASYLAIELKYKTHTLHSSRYLQFQNKGTEISPKSSHDQLNFR